MGITRSPTLAGQGAIKPRPKNHGAEKKGLSPPRAPPPPRTQPKGRYWGRPAGKKSLNTDDLRTVSASLRWMGRILPRPRTPWLRALATHDQTAKGKTGGQAQPLPRKDPCSETETGAEKRSLRPGHEAALAAVQGVGGPAAEPASKWVGTRPDTDGWPGGAKGGKGRVNPPPPGSAALPRRFA